MKIVLLSSSSSTCTCLQPIDFLMSDFGTFCDKIRMSKLIKIIDYFRLFCISNVKNGHPCERGAYIWNTYPIIISLDNSEYQGCPFFIMILGVV